MLKLRVLKLLASSLEDFQEYPHGSKNFPDWYSPHFNINNGFVNVPDKPGLGLEYDDAIWKNAVKI